MNSLRPTRLVSRTILAVAFFVISAAASMFGQTRVPPVFNGAPAAQWIAPPDTTRNAAGVYHFRRTLALPGKPARFIVHVSADNRYRLFVNGRSIATGPQRSDLANWRYETIDLAPYLVAGNNVLAALVWNWGATKPVAQFSHRTGFLLQGDSAAEGAANTGRDWRTLAPSAYEFLPISNATIGGYYAAPPGEAVDGTRYPWGWEQTAFDDSAWPAAALLAPMELRGTHLHGEAGGWQLTPRTLPPMEESPVRFAAVRRSSEASVERSTVDVPAHTKVSFLLDQSHLTNAFAVVELSGGAGATISLTYAEALKDAQGRKGNRNEIDGKTLIGVRDVFRPDGGAHRRFQTLWFRTYRYVQVEIETAGQPLELHDIHGVFTAYPFTAQARFTSDLPWLANMWRMNWRVARLCAWETYFDTPYYEQLQYVGDTRIQALLSYYMSGDDRLAREAIAQFDASRIPEGLTASRYPSELPQYIPPFSLLWVAMVHDHWMHRDDEAFVRGRLPGVRAVLARYAQAVDATGLVGPMPWWNFADWTPAWRRGVPPGADDGHSTLISLLFVYALQRGAELETALGQSDEAVRLHALADRIRATVREQAWHAGRGLFADAPGVAAFSQQTNTLAILTDTVPAAGQRSLMETLLADASLTHASYYFGFYVREALLKSGLGERYIEQLAPWQEMLRLGLTTTPENPEPTRSDSHAWSAHPNYGLLATVLGIRPAAPGFRAVHIAPHLGSLQNAEGAIPHSRGEISVKLTRQNATGLKAEVTLPAGLTGTFEWNGQRVPLREGAQKIEL